MCASLLHMHECPMCRERVPSSTSKASKKATDALVPPRLKSTHVISPEISTHMYNKYTSHHYTFRNCPNPNEAVPILAFTDNSCICYAKQKPISIVNSSRRESIRACMCGSKQRAVIHVSTCITICETLVTYSQTDSGTLHHSFCMVGDYGYIHCNKYPNLVLNVITPS